MKYFNVIKREFYVIVVLKDFFQKGTKKETLFNFCISINIIKNVKRDTAYCPKKYMIDRELL